MVASRQPRLRRLPTGVVFSLGMLSALALVVLGAADRAELSAAGPADIADGEGASVQSCITDCQSRFTDCSLRCDADPACVRGCQAVVDKCVSACREQKRPAEGQPDAGVVPSVPPE